MTAVSADVGPFYFRRAFDTFAREVVRCGAQRPMRINTKWERWFAQIEPGGPYMEFSPDMITHDLNVVWHGIAYFRAAWQRLPLQDRMQRKLGNSIRNFRHRLRVRGARG